MPMTVTEASTRKKKKLAVESIAEGNSTPPAEQQQVAISMFDYCVENHLRAVDTISRVCQLPTNNYVAESERKRLSSMVTFLREWKYLTYKPRVFRFAAESENSLGKDVAGDINLPQFSAATVPNSRLSKDFVLYVGGPVWALDWCPRVNGRSDCHVSCEFIAVGAHPPDSSYHRIGAPLTGKCVIQIWCVLNVMESKEYVIPAKTSKVANPLLMKPRGRPRKNPVNESPNNLDCNSEEGMTLDSKLPKKERRERLRKNPIKESLNNLECNSEEDMNIDRMLPKKENRRRLRKNPIIESPDNLDCNDEAIPVTIIYPDDMATEPVVDGGFTSTRGSDLHKSNGRKRKSLSHGISVCNSAQSKKLMGKGKSESRDVNIHLRSSSETEIFGSQAVNSQSNNSHEQHCFTVDDLDYGLDSNYIPDDVTSPRMVLCLAHNGKVTWDAKWRPTCVNDVQYQYRMGYLAVILGNGSLEVWDVPLPSTVSALFSYSPKEGTDPRFVKLNPVFKCSKLKCGDIQSIPLTVEWSSSLPHDFILAGCHDGTVALWKFCPSDLIQDTKPLLCFSADTAPIRAVAWAPVENDPESSNVIVTAGHEGLKFWDIRDPFRPIWDLNVLKKVTIYSMVWLPNPRCIISSIDDGTLKLLSLSEASYDVPVTGKPFDWAKLKGLHTYHCSSFPIWSIHASHSTGMVAYCTSDGNVHRFQLTTYAVEKNSSRNRPPTFLCGSIAEEKSTLTINTPVSDSPLLMKKLVNGSGATSMRDFMIDSTKGRINNPEINGQGQIQTSDDRTLALCSNDYVETKTPAQKDKCTLKSVPFNSRGSAENAQANLDQFEVMPSKIVALHRVRWNSNKGSERWLCYGGAAGIVRCQQVVFS